MSVPYGLARVQAQGILTVRDNHRHLLVEAALDLLHSMGAHSVTQNTVAEHAGLTRQGLLYHFRTKAALAEALHERVAQDLEERISERPAGSNGAGIPERLREFIAACAEPRTFVELQLLEDAGFNSPGALTWRSTLLSRAPCRTEPGAPLPAPGLLIACLAAEGLLVHEALHGVRLSEAELHRITEVIVSFASNPGGLA